MKVITIANRKGGTGKTITAYHLGFMYALQKKKVLFVDLDSQGNLTLLCNKETISLENFKSIEIESVNKMVDILPATKRFTRLENEINDLIDRNTFLKKHLLPEIQEYDYVIIDTPPSLNILNINAFCISDYVYIVMNADYFSVAGTKEMKNILEEIKNINPKLEYKIVLNAFFKNRKLTASMEQVLQKETSYTGIEIPHRQHVQNCILKKKPALDIEDIYNPFRELVKIGV